MHSPIVRTPRFSPATLAWFLVLAITVRVGAEDWPTYRHDISRSGITAEQLKLPLSPRWTFEPIHKPQPAWENSNPRPVGGWYGLTEGPRTRFDDAYQVAIAGNRVFFGSSASGKIRALDLASGDVVWERYTGGPVRLAPTVWKGNVYVGSDDGFVYCIDTISGWRGWKVRAALGRRLLLGNGHMISLWPVRSGVLVDKGIAYFGAGLFPEEGVAMYAVDAVTGRVKWRNDTCAGVGPSSRFSPQGYLLASKNRLYVPQGRVSPAALDRATGKLVFQTFVNHHIGGTYALLAAGELYTGTNEVVAVNENSPRDRLAWFWGRQLLIKDKIAYVAGSGTIQAIDRARHGKASLERAALLDRIPGVKNALRAARRRKDKAAMAAVSKQLKDLEKRKAELEREIAAAVRWKTPCRCEDALIMAGGTLFVGGKGMVQAVDSATGKIVWEGEVPGRAKGLAVANGGLVVSTDTGALVCFGSGSEASGSRRIHPTVKANPYPADKLTTLYATAARHMLEWSGVDKGYCLVLGAETGRLAYEIARQSELTVIGVEPDLAKVEKARRALDAAGLYGTRVTILPGSLQDVPFSDYFANLIVSDRILIHGFGSTDSADTVSPKELFRLLKPCGGVAVIGRPAGSGGMDSASLRAWLARTGEKKVEIRNENGVWGKMVRGALPGAGSWTHEYAEPGNTTCSDDQLVRGPLGLLWFGKPGPHDAVDRHARVVAPVCINGRFFREGYNVVRAYDAYNGVKLWERKLSGVARRGTSYRASNMVADARSLFLAIGDHCLRLDAETGKTTATWKTPPDKDGKSPPWGYLGVTNGLVYGSRGGNPRAADAVFAIAPETGKTAWLHPVQTVPNPTISLSGGQLFLVETKVSEQERRKVLAKKIASATKLKGKAREKADAAVKSATVYAVNALNATTGKPIWRRPMDLTGCVLRGHHVTLATIASRGVVLIFSVYTDGHYWKEFYAGQFDGRRVVALSATDGRTLWSKNIGYRVRPVVVGDTLYAEPWAYDLRTGKQKKRLDPVAGKEEPWQFARPGHHCGAPAAAPHMLLFRSYCLAWYDLDADYGTIHFGGQRPGCWINFIPANGLLIVPEASSGCLCPFPIQTTVVFKHMEKKPRGWAYFSSTAPAKPVDELAVNFGAPGDRKTPDGKLWLGFPRPHGALVYSFPMTVSFYPGGSYHRVRTEDVEIAGTEAPWLFASAAQRIRRCEIPLLGDEDGPSLYRIVLGFAETADTSVGKRVFDIKIQGKTRIKAFDPVRAAGGAHRAVFQTIDDVLVKDKLVIEFVSKAGGNPGAEVAPVVSCLRVERRKVLSVGMAVPAWLLNDAKPRQTGTIRLTNDTEHPFKGTLRVDPPPGFAAEPPEKAVDIKVGARLSIPMTLRVAKKGTPANLKARFQLVREDGTVEISREAPVEYLGPLTRITVRAAEDTFVQQWRSSANFAKSGSLNVDGGSEKMGDRDHSLGFVRFRFDTIHGVTRSVKLRLRVSENEAAGSYNGGRVCLAGGPWDQNNITYAKRPPTGREIGKVGRVRPGQVLEIPLNVKLDGKNELSIVLDPQSCDGTSFFSRESGSPPSLIIDYQPANP